MTENRESDTWTNSPGCASEPKSTQVKLIDATPIGVNVRSTVATYANIHDELRKIFARTQDAKNDGL